MSTLTAPAGVRTVALSLVSVIALSLVPGSALAWGDLGHEVVAKIAEHYLEPSVRSKIRAILAADRSRLTAATDMASEATWADKYRDSDRDTRRAAYYQTRNWHFINLELAGPDLNSACFGRPPQSPGRDASRGAAADCVVDKIEEFAAELQQQRTSRKERLLALQFVLHLVGDVHQPLHASDDHDEGGSEKVVTGPGLPEATLHNGWDTAFVLRLGSDAEQIASQLISKITASQGATWAAGTPSNWARESFGVAKAHTYGMLPVPTTPRHYVLSTDYVADATAVTAAQLSKAGVRLAYLLNQALR